MLIILFFYFPSNTSSFAMSKGKQTLPTSLLDMLKQTNPKRIRKIILLIF